MSELLLLSVILLIKPSGLDTLTTSLSLTIYHVYMALYSVCVCQVAADAGAGQALRV